MFSQIVLLRHATRSAVLDFAEGLAGGESPLNTIGLAQAQDFAELVKAGLRLPAPTRLFASPKLRARQTLQPLSKAVQLPLEILDTLDERRNNESASSFEQRVRQIPLHLNDDGVLYLCTHLDVLEAAALSWPTNFSERERSHPWSTLEYQLFNVNESILEAAARGRVEPGSQR